MTATILEESEEAFRAAIEALSSDGIVVVPSRTNYALICDTESEAGIRRVFDAKRRTKFGPLTLAIPTIESIDRYVALSPELGVEQLKEIWPAEVSFIYDLTYPFPSQMTMGAGTVAVMFQRDCALNRLLERYQRPVALTSANLSGQGNIVVTREKAIEDVGEVVDVLIVNNRLDEVVDPDAEGVNPSNTIVDLTFEVPYLVREGALPSERLLPFIPNLVRDPEKYKAALQERLAARAASG